MLTCVENTKFKKIEFDFKVVFIIFILVHPRNFKI